MRQDIADKDPVVIHRIDDDLGNAGTEKCMSIAGGCAGAGHSRFKWSIDDWRRAIGSVDAVEANAEEAVH